MDIRDGKEGALALVLESSDVLLFRRRGTDQLRKFSAWSLLLPVQKFRPQI